MTPDLKSVALKNINIRRKEITIRMKELTRPYGYPLPEDGEEYDMLRIELLKLDYQSIEIKEHLYE